MTEQREAELIHALRPISCTAELDAFRAQITRQGETVTAKLFQAMEAKAGTLRRRT
jgi:hypothetical protein